MDLFYPVFSLLCRFPEVPLTQNTQPNQQKQPFETQKNELLGTIKNITFNSLTKEQIDCLNRLKIAPYIGHDGVNLIEDILYKNVIDIATSVNKLQEIINHLANGIQISNNIRQNLSSIIAEKQDENVNDILIRITFKSDTYIKNFTDLKKWSNIWYEIIYGITLAHDSTTDDVKIIGATKGSIILELIAILAIATTISKILLEALKVAEKILDIKKKAEEIRELKLKNDKLASEIENEAENEKSIGTDTIIKIVLEHLNIKKDGTGDKVAALSKSITNLIDFLEKGGEIDFIIPQKEDNTEEKSTDFDNLKLAFTEIRKLESRILLLEEHK